MSAKLKEQIRAAAAEFVRVFVASGLAAYLTQVTTVGQVEYPGQAVLFAAVTAALPVAIRAVNPGDGGFGRGYVPSWQATVADDVAVVEGEGGE